MSKQNIVEKENNQHDTFGRVDCQVIPPINTIENIDCMEMLKKCPDKYFDLAIVDPPYGIGFDGHSQIIGKSGKDRGFYNKKLYTTKEWDASPPPQEYFEELFRVSKSQIVWGGNYFILPISKGWIFWDKKPNAENLTFSDGELAWTSFNCPLKKVVIGWIGFEMLNSGEKKIHPTQKPVTLYRWILKRFAKAGDLILDTHVGSGSSIVACIEGGFNYYGCEIDKDYYDAARSRIARAFRQYDLNFNHEAV